MTTTPPHGLLEPPGPAVIQTADHLRKCIGNGGLGQLEFEVRLGALDSRKRFLSNVPEAKVDKLQRFFETQGTNWQASESHTREVCWGGANGRLGAETTRLIVDMLNPAAPPLILVKRKMALVDDPGPPATRCSIALERVQQPAGEVHPPAASTTRIKKRRSFSNGVFQVDITRVASAEDDRFTCEVEIELVDKTIFFRKTFEAVAADALAIAKDLGAIVQ